MQLHPVAVRMLLALSFILALSFAFGCKKKDPAEGKDTGAPPVAELDDVTNGEEDDPEAGTPPNDNDACAVPKEEVEGVIGMTISEVFRQGNWGIASTCSYAIPNGPPPVEISSIASTEFDYIQNCKDIQTIGEDSQTVFFFIFLKYFWR